MAAQFVREIDYTTWLSNVVMVKKPNEKWKICTNYTDLNRACLKEAYPLPNIDRLVDGAAEHKLLSFLSAYSGYNQIKMNSVDKKKMTFLTKFANYYYKVMSFELKNAEDTYQRLMDKVFMGQLGRNLEVCVDDLVVKFDNLATHITDLEEVFRQLKKYNMRLNLEKCVFGVEKGNFLGFMLTH